MLKPILGACSASAFLAVAAWAQAPEGPEFRVNTSTIGSQFLSSVASDANGNFVVVWSGVFGQRFSAEGARLGDEFRVNSYTTGVNSEPHVASDASGNFVVVWHSQGQDGSGFGTFAKRYSAAGVPLGAEFQVNTFTTGNQGEASVASNASGNFVVVWTSEFQDGGGPGPPGSDHGVFGQRFSAAGVPLGAEFRVNTFTLFEQGLPSVASDPSGNFVVVWQSYFQDGNNRGIFGQRFSAAGAPLGAEFRVNTFTLFLQARPSVASDASGNFVVTWTSQYQDGPSFGVFGQRFSAAGTPLGAEFRVNTFTASHQWLSSVASDASGNFVVAWQSEGQDGGGPGPPGGDSGVFGQRFSAAGAPLGAEFRVNTFTPDVQAWPAVASLGTDKFVVTWDSETQDGSAWGVFGQRFAGLQAMALSVDVTARPTSDGNSVFEPGEIVDVAPTWRNVTGFTQSFGGTAGTFVGPGAPGDPDYAVWDGTASYGTVPDGTSASCTSAGDCYVLGISVPSTRPIQHWDASVREDITPAIHEQWKEWVLHVGDSFSDVPRSGGFYRFIETLLHHGITAGCGPTTYCPLSGTTREQMAVFVLRTLDPALSPPPCVPPNIFGDMPETNPFCRWIEELANRGIVTGCGGGNYCPTAPVTREQMGVFISATFALTLYGP